ncbi:MAG: phage tail tape measure protein [Kiritimatiellae bacterium]|nr:phage tail tape measure protein [Kiritimatiellia bacterium]
MASRDLRGLTIEIGGDTSNLTDALRNVDGELSNLQSNLRTVNSALRLDPGNVDALAQRQALLTDAVAETTQRLELLREAQRQADQQIADGVEVDQRAYRNLQSEIVRAEASLADYERQANDAGDESNDAAQESAEGWTIVKDVIADLASQAIQAAIDGFKDLLFEGEKALDTFQAKTGLSSDAMEYFGDAARDVFKGGWGESLSDVSGVMAEIYNTLGDMDADYMKAFAENAMTLTDVFGWDTQEQLRAVNSLMNQFGLTSDEAFNLMVQGAQLGLDQNGDLLDTINEYSVQFKNAGYSANDMFNMLANGAETGTWSVDKLGDAVKEYNIRMSDGTVIDYINENAKALGLTAAQAESLGKKMLESGGASKEAMGAILNGILSIEDPTERYKAGVGAFGTMWEDLGEEAVKALFDTKGGIDSTNAAMSQVKTDAYDNLAASITSLGRTLKDELLQPIVDAFTPALKASADAMREFAAGSISMDELFARIGAAASEMIAIIKNNLPRLAEMGGQLLSNLVQGIVNGIPKLISAAGEMIRSLSNGIKSNMGEFISKGLDLINGLADSLARSLPTLIASGVQMLRNLVQGLMSALPELISRVPEIISKFANLINDNAPTIIAAGFGIIKDLIVGIINAIPTLIQNIPKIITAIVDVWEAFNWANLGKKAITLLKDGCLAVVNLVKNAGKTILDGIVNVIKNLPQNLATLGRNAISDLGGAIRGMLSNVKSAATEIFNGIVNTIKNLPSQMLNIGKDIVRGLWNGISDMTGWVIGKIQGFGDSVLSGIKKFFGIQSPSKLMRDEIGRYLAEGIGEGIEENADSALDPMQALRDDLAAIDSLNVSRTIGINADSSQGETRRLAAQMNELTALVKAYLPEIANKASKNIYVDKKRLVGELISDIDEGLGEIANRRAVGAV